MNWSSFFPKDSPFKRVAGAVSGLSDAFAGLNGLKALSALKDFDHLVRRLHRADEAMGASLEIPKEG